MWEYKRIETGYGSYTASKFIDLLNNYAKDGWEIIHYWEDENSNLSCYKFKVVMKRLCEEQNVEKDDEVLNFVNDLKQLDKNEIIKCLGSYFHQLKLEASCDIKTPETEHMRNEFGKIKMTQVNRLKFFVKSASSDKI